MSIVGFVVILEKAEIFPLVAEGPTRGPSNDPKAVSGMVIETSASLARSSSIHPATLSCACIVRVRHDPARPGLAGETLKSC